MSAMSIDFFNDFIEATFTVRMIDNTKMQCYNFIKME